MAELERLKIQLSIADNSQDELLLDLLESAKSAILTRRYPFGNIPADEYGKTILEARFLDLQIRIAVFLFNKRGAEGQTSHSENGISRSYENADIPESMLKNIAPFVGGFNL